MRNRSLIGWSALVALALLATACPRAPTEEEEPVARAITVIFPRHEADVVGAFESRIKDFEEESGIRVNLIQADWDSVADKVLTEMATGGSAYDVVEFDNGWVAQWCGAGWTNPLDEFMPAGYTEGMIPGLVDLFSCPDGKVHGLVWNNDTRFFYYNAEALAEAGFQAPPTTWDELRRQSLQAQQMGGVKHAVAGPWEQEWALVNELHFWTYTFGGQIVDDRGCFLFNEDPNTRAALQFMVDMVKSKVADPASPTYDQEAAQNVFLKGDALFVPQGIAGLMAYSEDPNLSNVQGDVKVGLVPGAESGLTATLTLPEAYAIPANSKNKEAAWRFIEFMTDRETNKELAQEIGLLPIWKDLYTDPDLVEKYPFWADFSDQLDSARGLSQVTWYGNFVDVAAAEVHSALLGRKSAQQALDDMAKRLSEFECQP